MDIQNALKFPKEIPVKTIITLVTTGTFGVLAALVGIPTGVMIGTIFSGAALRFTSVLPPLKLTPKWSFLISAMLGFYLGRLVTLHTIMKLREYWAPAIFSTFFLFFIPYLLLKLEGRFTIIDVMRETAGGGSMVPMLAKSLGLNVGLIVPHQVSRMLVVPSVIGVVLFIFFGFPKGASMVGSSQGQNHWWLIPCALFIGALGALILRSLEVPSGTLLGGLLSVASFSIIMGLYGIPSIGIPPLVSVGVQLSVGYYVVSKIEDDFIQSILSDVLGPLSTALKLSFLGGLLSVGQHMFFGIDWMTALFACAPGAASELTTMASVYPQADLEFIQLCYVLRLLVIAGGYPLVCFFLFRKKQKLT